MTPEAFCAEKHLYVAEVLEEVVSGESLSSRPKMMRLLELVNTGMYAGVICVDIERLSRGSSLESGYIMQVFQANVRGILQIARLCLLVLARVEQWTWIICVGVGRDNPVGQTDVGCAEVVFMLNETC